MKEPSGSLKLPRYAIVGDRPVMAERTEDGGMRTLAYDWKTGELVGEGGHLIHLFFPSLLPDPDEAAGWDAGGDIEFVSKKRFDQKVAELRAKLSH